MIKSLLKGIECMFDNKVNVLKALAITLVVSGHLEFSLLGIFPPYSFQLALFFFISGYLNLTWTYSSDAFVFLYLSSLKRTMFEFNDISHPSYISENSSDSGMSKPSAIFLILTNEIFLLPASTDA